jgi:hypothetical protein
MGLHPGHIFFSHSILTCTRRGDLFDAIMSATEGIAKPVPTDFSTYLSRDDKYEEPHYGTTTETPYGNPLMWVQARALRQFRTHEGVRDNPTNKAVWAYLANIPPYTPIALYWH